MSRKFGFIILLLFALSYLVGCGDNGPQNNTGGGGSDEPGGGSLAIEFWGTPPSSYDPNSQSRFEVSFEPTIQGYTSGRCRIWFKLCKGDSKVAVSNCVDFPYYDTGVKTVEFGGALPNIETSYEEFEIRGLILHYEDAIVTNHAETGLQYIIIHSMNPPTKIMHIEYDHQVSYDIFTRDEVQRDLDIAFNVAETGFDILTDQTELVDEYIDYSEIGRYQVDRWQNSGTHHMHLMGIKGATNKPDPDTDGVSVNGEWGYSVIFLQDIRDKHPDEIEDDIIEKVVIHELGHHRGSLTHASGEDAQPELHDPQPNFCVMNQDIAWEYNGIVRNFYDNPHFCNSCVDRIKNVTWNP